MCDRNTSTLDTTCARLDACISRWNLRIEYRLAGGYPGDVYACTDRAGSELVLKLSPPTAAPGLEAAALRLWDGNRSVTLVDSYPPAGPLLLERITPGSPLPPGDDDTAGSIAAGVLGALHATRLPADHPFPMQARAFDSRMERTMAEAESGTTGLGLLDRCRAVATRLWSSTDRTVLLHGDFIDKNILLGPDGYVTIDPMPCVGDPCSDVGFFAAYHPPARHIATRARRIARLLGYDPSRAERWAAVWAVGEACETWRADSDELQTWISGPEAQHLL